MRARGAKVWARISAAFSEISERSLRALGRVWSRRGFEGVQVVDVSSVVPIEGVQLCIGVLELKRQLLACGNAARHRVTHLGLLVFEAVGQCDAGPVFLPADGVFDRLYIGFGNTRDPNSRAPFLAIDVEVDRGEERLDPIGTDGREDLPVRPPC